MNILKSMTSVVAVAVLGTALMTSLVNVGPRTAVAATPNMTPNYEIHALLDPNEALNPDHTLKNTVLSAFNITAAPDQMNVQYMDTNNQDLSQEGWSARIRKMTGDSKFKLNYKKRYPITGNNITAALNQANQEGFDSSDTNYEAQVEWSYGSKTLSISTDKNVSISGYTGLTLPNQTDSVNAIVNNIPGKLNKWTSTGWGTSVLNQSRVYGPVYATRYTGTFNGIKTYIEIWPIKNTSGTGYEYIVEASFKVDTESDAANSSSQLFTYLQSRGWFLPQDALKTSTILQRY
ncbi:hypothetical protein NV379_11955 [Paenibacillus sp. N1-5-1-14]|uniref:hypothetical protein n=1 Tax=Paenibacillus radicibacter TaxID=2972488 RepID=UPI002159639B|nr:hypothetical protein [Paenibacillus radicibacter]MCR8643366.1 hypothetical protein [Paenibacillus radicibacter]